MARNELQIKVMNDLLPKVTIYVMPTATDKLTLSGGHFNFCFNILTIITSEAEFHWECTLFLILM